MVLKYFPQHRVLKQSSVIRPFLIISENRYFQFCVQFCVRVHTKLHTELKVTVLLCFDIYVSMKHGRWGRQKIIHVLGLVRQTQK